MARRNNNDIDNEIATIFAQLRILERREDEFQKLINDMQLLRDSTHAEKLELSAKSRALEAEKHPVNWLPTELLVTIFVVVSEFTQSEDEDEYRAVMAYHHPIVTVSHVSQRWRSIALSTPPLWANLSYRGTMWGAQFRRAFLQRSSTAPLHFDYRGSQDKDASLEEERISENLDDILEIFERSRSITFHSLAPEAIEKVVGIINSSFHTFPQLQSLNLAILCTHPLLSDSVSLKERHETRKKLAPRDIQTIPSWIQLKHLELREIPLFNIPIHYLVNITTLKLCFPPRSSALRLGRAFAFELKMSELCHFLEFTPALENLVLMNTVPLFDVFLHEDGITSNSPNVTIRPRVPLLHLKRFKWSYPFPAEVHWLMTIFDIPALESLDIWTEERPHGRNGHCQISGPHDNLVAEASERRGLSDIQLLRDLSLVQCFSEANTRSLLRRFGFPILEKFAFANSDYARGTDNPLPSLSRAESIFRDPRLPHLTHLTLSHFNIPSGDGRAEAMMGYMPALTSLSLDTCTGVRTLIESLQEKAVGTLEYGSQVMKTRRGVKVWPRLEALSFWGCDDIDIQDVRAVVATRNKRNDKEGDQSGSNFVPNGATLGMTERKQIHGRKDETMMGRKVKPLRKPLHQNQGNLPPGSDLCSQ